MGKLKKNKIFPLGYHFLTLCASFGVLLCLFLVAGGFLIFYGTITAIEVIIIGCAIIILGIALITFAVFSIRDQLKIVINDYWLKYYCCEIKLYSALKRNCIEVSFSDLQTLEIENHIFKFIYFNGEKILIDLKYFSEKQIVIIKAEILKRACKLNGVATNLIEHN